MVSGKMGTIFPAVTARPWFCSAVMVPSARLFAVATSQPHLILVVGVLGPRSVASQQTNGETRVPTPCLPVISRPSSSGRAWAIARRPSSVSRLFHWRIKNLSITHKPSGPLKSRPFLPQFEAVGVFHGSNIKTPVVTALLIDMTFSSSLFHRFHLRWSTGMDPPGAEGHHPLEFKKFIEYYINFI